MTAPNLQDVLDTRHGVADAGKPFPWHPAATRAPAEDEPATIEVSAELVARLDQLAVLYGARTGSEWTRERVLEHVVNNEMLYGWGEHA